MTAFCSVRDPVHDFIALDRTECKIVNTSIFQRLRGIRQLAMAYLVYPGALHTRFDHSLGVYHIAGGLASALRLTADDTRIVKLAALLHDIGHGPFSHVAENALRSFANRSALGDKAKSSDSIHELLAVDIIQTNPELGNLLSNDERNTICDLLSKGHGEPIL